MSSGQPILRFLINGLVAACAHFAVLTFFMEVVRVPSAAAANIAGAIVGVSVSFVGNRHFVFRAAAQPITTQALRFMALYALTTLLHGAVLFVWTDRGGQDYRLGFLIATALQVIVSYLGNRWLVFPTEG